jgi:hypothetical protein
MLGYPALFIERLGEHDFQVLAGLDGARATADEMRHHLRDAPHAVDGYLADARLYAALFADPEADDIQVLTPALVFAVLVHQTIRDLEATSYVSEWVGAGERLPVFDVESLRGFIDDMTRRFMVIELLTSFTRVASGSMWVRTNRGYRRRRYSELDPLSLAEMVQGLPELQRPAGYRRLGDVALFLTGVFPDHTARHPLSAIRRERLIRSTGVAGDWDEAVDYVHFLEGAGSRWYDRAAHGPLVPADGQQHLQDMAAHFSSARRFLNYLADRYLHQFETGLMNPVA